MLSLFRTNQLLYSVFLLIYAAVLRVSHIVLPDENWAPSAPGLLSDRAYDLLGGYSAWSASVAALLILVIQAAAINAIALRYRLGEASNLFPGVFFVLLCSILPDMMHLSPALMANGFLLIALNEMFSVYKKPAAAAAIFNIGFWIAIASLFSPAYIVFLLLGFTGLNLLRGLSVRERLMMLVGAVLPYFLGGVYLFWTGNLEQGIAQQIHKGFSWWAFKPDDGFPVSAAAVVYGLVILLALINYAGLVFRKTIQVQKYISMLYWMLLIGGATMLVQPGVQIEQWLAVAIPAGILLGFIFTKLPNRWAESLHLMLFAAILILQYKEFFLP